MLNYQRVSIPPTWKAGPNWAFTAPAAVSCMVFIVAGRGKNWSQIWGSTVNLKKTYIVWCMHTNKHYITLHYITLHYITLHYITLHYIALHYLALHYISYVRTYITSHHIISHHITSYHITSHHIKLHYITSRHITLHYIHTCAYIYT